VVGRGPLAANALGLGGELVVPAIQTVGGQFLDLDRGRNPGVEQVFCALHRDRLFLGLDFGEIVGDCILDGVGARACMLGENSFSIWKTILSVSSRKVRQWRLRQSVLRRITD
jgi:hypothetical protein